MLQSKWLSSALSVAILGSVLLGGCKKENGIDNNSIIRTPFTLYYTDEQGSLYNTNDGEKTKNIFPPDGFIIKSVITSGTNILFVKNNAHLSLNNGQNFNITDYAVIKDKPFQSLMLDVPDHGRIYLAVNTGNPSDKGIKYSEDTGKTWTIDINWDASLNDAPIQSFAQLKNNELYAWNNVNQVLYQRIGKAGLWTQVVPVVTLPAGGDYFLSRINNTLIATDYNGTNGVSYSNDGGINWAQYAGLPNVKLHACAAPFDLDLFVGTEGMGIWKLQPGGVFVPRNSGLENNTEVYGIVGKSDAYKNEALRQYIFSATSDGLYRSQDGGNNWVQVKPGNLRGLY